MEYIRAKHLLYSLIVDLAVSGDLGAKKDLKMVLLCNLHHVVYIKLSNNVLHSPLIKNW